MKLIDALTSGIASAPGGTATITARGGSTAATWYPSFEGGNGSDSVVTLDGDGAAVVYVNQAVDVVVRDVNGTKRRTFTAGEDFSSPAFTGEDYDAGIAAANKPNSMQELLDLWLEVNGAKDWKVLFGGAEVSIKSALGSLIGFVYNVKSADYGATGDGSADDTSPIVAAITAASAAGGGTVYFPPGAYKTTSEITLPEGVNLLGWSKGACTLRLDKAGNTDALLVIPGNVGGADNSKKQFVRGLTLAYGVANTHRMLEMNVPFIDFVECTIGDGTYATNTLAERIIPSSYGEISFRDCLFNCLDDYAYFDNGGSPCKLTMVDCYFIANLGYSTGSTMVYAGPLKMRGCSFDFSACASASGTNTAVKAPYGGSVEGCLFHDLQGGETNVLVCIDPPTSGTLYLAESGNRFGEDDLDPTRMIPYNNSSTALLLPGSHPDRYLEQVTSASTATIYPGYFGHTKLEVSGGQTAMTMTFGAGVAEGVGFVLELSTQGNGAALATIAFPAFVDVDSSATASLADGKTRLLRFRGVQVPSGGSLRVAQDGTPVDVG